MSKILGFLFNRITIIVLLMLVQAAALAVSIWGLSHYFVYLYRPVCAERPYGAVDH